MPFLIHFAHFCAKQNFPQNFILTIFSFNPLRPGGNKKVTGLLKYV